MSDDDLKLIAELEALEKEEAKRKRWTEWCPHTPWPKQAKFLALTCPEALYGGAAAGGKSDALLMGALQYVDQPGYAALILRRTFRDLKQPDAIMARSHEWLHGTRASWSERDKRWTFPSGATLTFGYIDCDADKYQYQGAALQYIAWDELTQFPEAWYSWLFSRLRKLEGVDIPLRVRAATNPGGLGHAWVYRRFIEHPSEDRPFIQALLKDNPSVDEKSYREMLARLDATTRRQMEDGIWLQDASGLVYSQPATVPSRPVQGEWSYLLGLDFGVKDATAFVVLGYRKHDRTVYVIESFKESGLFPSDVAQKVLKLQETYPFTKIVGDLGGLGKGFAEEMIRRFSIPVEAAQKVNKRGYIGLLNGALERRELLLVQPTNTALLKEMAELPWKDESHQHEADGFDNHLTDALLYAWRAATAFSQTPFVAPPTDPAEIIRRQTAAIWTKYEEDLAREKAQERSSDYDLGGRWLDPEHDW